MEAFMKILVSAAALVIALAWPTAGDAQSKKAKARSATTTQQQYVRHAKVGVRRGEKPCAARTWAGCQGWDPDPNVRSMIQMDAGRDDY
jgi:hypothetical protein